MVFREAGGLRAGPAGINSLLLQVRAFDVQCVLYATFPGQVLMDVLNDNMEGLSGESEDSLVLRRLWDQAWRRTAMQVESAGRK